MDKSKTLARVRALIARYESGAIPTLSEHEVNPGLPLGSRENYLYFTLPVCLNFQRSSPAMWRSALKTYTDPETNYLFFPERVETTPPEKVRDDLRRHGLSLQPNRHTDIWMRISHTLHANFNDDPRKVLAEARNDAGKLIRLLQVDRKKDFPYLCGPKLSNYWPFILSKYTDAHFANIHEISIIPDTHVIQSTLHLGLTSGQPSSLVVEAIWRELLDGSGISPVTVHPVLWNWSRAGFLPAV